MASEKSDRVLGFFESTGHPLQEPLSKFVSENASWVRSQDASISFGILGKPWAEAAVLVTPAGWDSDEPVDALRREVNRRLVAAGFKTHLPKFDRDFDGHILKGQVETIWILGLAAISPAFKKAA